MSINDIKELKKRTLLFEEKAQNLAKQGRLAFRKLRKASLKQRNASLLDLASRLREPSCIERILKANALDIQEAQKKNLAPSLQDRLLLDAKRIESMCLSLEEIAVLPDPVGEVIRGNTLGNGIELVQKRVPLGLIFTIYESRPNVSVDVGALCIKSGNCVILRGGKEAFHSNQILCELFSKCIQAQDLPKASLQFVSDTDRAFLLALLGQDANIDLVVPRGGNALISFISENSHIPVVKHDKGVCNMYLDKSANYDMAVSVTCNSKLQRTSVCNALENLVIHKDFPKIKNLLIAIERAGAQLLGCEKTKAIYEGVKLIKKEEEDSVYHEEFLDSRLSIKIVENQEQALDFIFLYSSGHSEVILAEDYQAILAFQENVDSAAIFVNCSTRFHDGGQMGFGAEVGISTGRLHVRGPMALPDLTTSSYFLSGHGQIRT